MGRDIDRHASVARIGSILQGEADLPGDSRIEIREAESLFLNSDPGEVLIDAQGGLRTSSQRPTALLPIPLPKRLSDDLSNNGRKGSRELAELPFQPAELVLQCSQATLHTVKPAFHPVQPRLDRSKIVAIAPRLFENIAGDGLFALDLALDDVDARGEMLELFLRGVSGHRKTCGIFARVDHTKADVQPPGQSLRFIPLP
jgi:hypothetical protein